MKAVSYRTQYLINLAINVFVVIMNRLWEVWLSEFKYSLKILYSREKKTKKCQCLRLISLYFAVNKHTNYTKLRNVKLYTVKLSI